MMIRFCAKKRGFLLKTSIELVIQKSCFLFLFIQIFLIVFLSSSFATIVNEIYHEFDFVPTIFVINIPKTSNNFFSYLLLKAFSINADNFFQTVNLVR